MTGRITRVVRSRACGFIRAANGQEVFFHASDLDGLVFDDLEERLTVRFDLIPDVVSGPRAALVQVDRSVSTNRRTRSQPVARRLSADDR